MRGALLPCPAIIGNAQLLSLVYRVTGRVGWPLHSPVHAHAASLLLDMPLVLLGITHLSRVSPSNFTIHRNHPRSVKAPGARALTVLFPMCSVSKELNPSSTPTPMLKWPTPEFEKWAIRWSFLYIYTHIRHLHLM